MPDNKADLYQPITHTQAGKAPLVIRAITQPFTEYSSTGPYLTAAKNEAYVMLSALPEELKQRVMMAIQALQAY